MDGNATSSHAAAAAAADSSHPDVDLRRIAFGSCHSSGALDRRRRRRRQTIQRSRETKTGDDDSPAEASASYSNETIWDAISSTVRPQAFLWTGDAAYPPEEIRGDAPPGVMTDEYTRMLDDEDLGYARFLRWSSGGAGGGITSSVHGTWDDHDYGGNDRGIELPEKEGRRDAYLEFLGVPRDSPRWGREGVYSSVDFGIGDPPPPPPPPPSENGDIDDGAADDSGGRHDGGVRVIFLDTRWHRDKHCIPSVASNPHVPYGSLVGCVTRWITAGLDLPSIMPFSRQRRTSWWCPEGGGDLLGDDQWRWLGGQLKDSRASIHVVVSSIQVLTTNPVIESWGHFPRERERLLRLLNGVPGLVILSGDVHHAEISSTSADKKTRDEEEGYNFGSIANAGAFVEVTSSGLTHSCDEPFYGKLCGPILDAFPAHRARGGNVRDADSPSYFTGRNFGSIEIDRASGTFRVRVHDEDGDVVLSTTCGMDDAANMSEEDIRGVPKCIDGHMWPFIRRVAPFHGAGLIFVCSYLFFFRSISRPKTTSLKKSKRA